MEVNAGAFHERFDIREFAEKITECGSAMQNICGFIDGTARRICQPSKNQGPFYSGYYGFHCIKFQSVMFPNGIIGILNGPFIGRRHDSGMVHESGIISKLTPLLSINGQQYYLYGDPGYQQSQLMFTPYSRLSNLNMQQQQFNKKMSRVRESVEWGFGKIASIFAFLDFHKNLKLFLQPVAEYYKVGSILANVHTCYYGSEVSDFFALESPTAAAYLSGRY